MALSSPQPARRFYPRSSRHYRHARQRSTTRPDGFHDGARTQTLLSRSRSRDLLLRPVESEQDGRSGRGDLRGRTALPRSGFQQTHACAASRARSVSAKDTRAVETQNQNDAELCGTGDQSRTTRLRAAGLVNEDQNVAQTGEPVWRREIGFCAVKCVALNPLTTRQRSGRAKHIRSCSYTQQGIAWVLGVDWLAWQ